MISEELLERGLHAAGERYVVPPGAVDRLHDRLVQPAVVSRSPIRLILRPRTSVG